MHVNVGSGEDMSIRALAGLVCEAVGFVGQIVCDDSKPDGTPRKLMSADRLRAMGWRPSIGLRDGIASTYAWLLSNPQILEK
jgi:GDP-L-fucose synthase